MYFFDKQIPLPTGYVHLLAYKKPISEGMTKVLGGGFRPNELVVMSSTQNQSPSILSLITSSINTEAGVTSSARVLDIRPKDKPACVVVSSESTFAQTPELYHPEIDYIKVELEDGEHGIADYVLCAAFKERKTSLLIIDADKVIVPSNGEPNNTTQRFIRDITKYASVNDVAVVLVVEETGGDWHYRSGLSRQVSQYISYFPDSEAPRKAQLYRSALYCRHDGGEFRKALPGER